MVVVSQMELHVWLRVNAMNTKQKLHAKTILVQMEFASGMAQHVS